MAELVELVNEFGTLPREGDGQPAPPGELTPLADELHPVFAATDPAARAALVTGLLDRSGVRPVLAGTGPAWTVDDPAQCLRAAAALALRHHPERIGVCADPQCADVYVDASPAGRRRFCCLTCQNRSRTAAFRRRHAASGAGAG
jgi:predicted RNA-binding Zn ribbon-like protein